MSTRDDFGMYFTDSEKVELGLKQPDDPGPAKTVRSRHWEYFWAGFGIGALIEMVVTIFAWFS